MSALLTGDVGKIGVDGRLYGIAAIRKRELRDHPFSAPFSRFVLVGLSVTTLTDTALAFGGVRAASSSFRDAILALP